MRPWRIPEDIIERMSVRFQHLTLTCVNQIHITITRLNSLKLFGYAHVSLDLLNRNPQLVWSFAPADSGSWPMALMQFAIVSLSQLRHLALYSWHDLNTELLAHLVSRLPQLENLLLDGFKNYRVPLTTRPLLNMKSPTIESELDDNPGLFHWVRSCTKLTSIRIQTDISCPAIERARTLRSSSDLASVKCCNMYSVLHRDLVLDTASIVALYG